MTGCVLLLAGSGTSSIKARFENIAKQKEEEDQKKAEEERARRHAKEKQEQEEARDKLKVPHVNNTNIQLIVEEQAHTQTDVGLHACFV